MRVLIIGAGTIGITHGWLLSNNHDVTWLVRPDRVAHYREPFTLQIHDLRRGHQDSTTTLTLKLVTSIDPGAYDVVLVMVPGGQLPEVLPLIEAVAGTTTVVFMLNHWHLAAAVAEDLSPSTRYLVGFPSQIGGGREGHRVTATVFPHGTILETDTPDKREALAVVKGLFTSAGLKVRRQRHMTDWLAVHSMQQSLTTAPVIEAGSYEAFTMDRSAIASLVDAFREGLRVCHAGGITTWCLWPAPLFLLPRAVVARALQGMFQQPETAAMVTGHMRHGLGEWIDGLVAIHTDAHRLDVSTPQIDHHYNVIATTR